MISRCLHCCVGISIGLLLIVGCIVGFSQETPGGQQAEGEAIKLPAFEVVSVRPDPRGQTGWMIGGTPDGYRAFGATMWMLVREAYGVFEDGRISGAPSWFTSDKFSIEAKVAEQDEAAFKKLDYNQRREMLQSILADRFKLSVHWEAKEMPIYALIVAKNGPKLHESAPDPDAPGRAKGMGGLVKRGSPHLIVEGGTMEALARQLSFATGRTVIDKTGLIGRYDYHLDWTPETFASPLMGATGFSAPASDSNAPSIFTAVQEQLGLKLDSQKGPVDVLVVDHAEKPSPN